MSFIFMAVFKASIFCRKVLILSFGQQQFSSTVKNSPSCHCEQFTSVSHLPAWLSLAWSGALSLLILLWHSILSWGVVRHLVGRWGGYSWMLNVCVRSCSSETTVSMLCSCSRSDVSQSWIWILGIHGGAVKLAIRGSFKDNPSESAWIMKVSNSRLYTDIISMSFSRPHFLFTYDCTDRLWADATGRDWREEKLNAVFLRSPQVQFYHIHKAVI